MGWSGKEGKGEAGKNREASRRGGEEEKRENKTRQIERPELVAATDSSQQSWKLGSQGPRGRAFQLQPEPGDKRWGSSERREEAEGAIQGPR